VREEEYVPVYELAVEDATLLKDSKERKDATSLEDLTVDDTTGLEDIVLLTVDARQDLREKKKEKQ
jgi:hypothetical protein